MMDATIAACHDAQIGDDRLACDILREEIDCDQLRLWLVEAHTVQWDYKNIVKRRGRLDWLGEGQPPA